MPGLALGMVGVWLSPAILLAVTSLLLADGTRGLWPPLALAAGAVLVAIVLAPPWAGLPAAPASLLDVAARRWPEAPLSRLLLAGTMGSAFVFLWAQLAATGELGATWGGSRPIVTGVAVLCLALAAWRREAGTWLGGVGAALALAGLLVPLAAVLAVSDVAWPRVWQAVAARPRTVFGETGPWVGEGHPVHGRGGTVTIGATEEQRVSLLGRGPVRLQLWEGQVVSREVSAPTDLTLRPGDRLTLPDGFPMRFQAGRRIPEAPASGLEWLDPPGRGGDGRALLGLGLTLAAGALGLAPAHAALGAGGRGGERAAALGAALVILGLVAAVLWSLYAAWLAPEVYVGGVAGGEAFELPALVPALGLAGGALRDLALLGLTGGAIAAGVVAVAAAPAAVPAPARLGGLAAAGLLAAVAPVDSWSLLVFGFGVAAACAPAAVFGCWRERLGPRAVDVGAAVGLGLFLLLSAAGRFSLPPGSWLGWLTTWPAAVAAPLGALATWLASAGPRPSRHAALPPGLASLHSGQ